MIDFAGVKTKNVSELDGIFGLSEFPNNVDGYAFITETVRHDKSSCLDRADLCINDEVFGSLYLAGCYFEVSSFDDVKSSVCNFVDFAHILEKDGEFSGKLSVSSITSLSDNIINNLSVDEDGSVLWHIDSEHEYYLDDMFVPCLVGIEIDSEKIIKLLAKNGYTAIISLPDIIRRFVCDAIITICEDFDSVCAVFPNLLSNNIYEKILSSEPEKLSRQYRFIKSDDNSGMYARYNLHSFYSQTISTDELKTLENSDEKHGRFILLKDEDNEHYFIFVNYDIDGLDLWEEIAHKCKTLAVEGVFDTAEDAAEAYKNTSGNIYCVILYPVRNIGDKTASFDVKVIGPGKKETIVPEGTVCVYDSYLEALEMCKELNWTLRSDS